MADNYLEFSEIIPRLTPKEEAWLTEQLQPVCVFGDKEYPEDDVPAELTETKPDWFGARFLRDNIDYDPQWGDLGFQYEFCDDHDNGGHVTDSWGRHLWIYTEDRGEPDNVAWLVQKFLKRFRHEQCWSLTYATTCSKPRPGAFGGGAVFVTANKIYSENAYTFIERKQAAFKSKPKASNRQKKAISRGKERT